MKLWKKEVILEDLTPFFQNYVKLCKINSTRRGFRAARTAEQNPSDLRLKLTNKLREVIAMGEQLQNKAGFYINMPATDYVSSIVSNHGVCKYAFSHYSKL